jgi:hypothetical protein
LEGDSMHSFIQLRPYAQAHKFAAELFQGLHLTARPRE